MLRLFKETLGTFYIGSNGWMSKIGETKDPQNFYIFMSCAVQGAPLWKNDQAGFFKLQMSN